MRGLVREDPLLRCITALGGAQLNTDHFSAGIRDDRRMTKPQFISNNRGVDPGLDAGLLGTIFDRICANEIVMSEVDARPIMCPRAAELL